MPLMCMHTASPHTTTTTNIADGKLIGEKGESDWLYVVPWGFKNLLHWTAKRYGNPGIYVTENGK